jgi:uncharacterized protein (DUF488 family)
VEICSIGFTKRTAESFFEALRAADVKQLIDVRLNNTSQLAGFAKRDDLSYFLERLLGVTYVHEPLLAPNQLILDEYKKSKGSWENYEVHFRKLMEEREIEHVLTPDRLTPMSALLCSEHTPDHCHRRLVIEYLSEKWGNVTAVHL